VSAPEAKPTDSISDNTRFHPSALAQFRIAVRVAVSLLEHALSLYSSYVLDLYSQNFQILYSENFQILYSENFQSLSSENFLILYSENS
jgi:hypothetical protein